MPQVLFGPFGALLPLQTPLGLQLLVARRGPGGFLGQAFCQFLVADYLFIALYAILSPIAIWRFGSSINGGSPPLWIKLAALLLLAAGVVDATENTLLFSATDAVSEDAVDAAHSLEIPKVTLFTAGTLLAIAVNARAVRGLRRR